MSNFVKKENLVISSGEYEKDGQTKKEWRTIGEIVTMNGDDGQPYQFFKLWGAGGVVEGKVFAPRDNNNQGQQQGQHNQQQGQQNNNQQQQQGGYQQQGQQQGGYQQQGQQQQNNPGGF